MTTLLTPGVLKLLHTACHLEFSFFQFEKSIKAVILILAYSQESSGVPPMVSVPQVENSCLIGAEN